MNDDDDDLKTARALEKKIMTVVLGYKDYIIMSAMTFAMASLLIWANGNCDDRNIEEELDLADEQLRSAVKGVLEKKKRVLS